MGGRQGSQRRLHAVAAVQVQRAQDAEQVTQRLVRASHGAVQVAAGGLKVRLRPVGHQRQQMKRRGQAGEVPRLALAVLVQGQPLLEEREAPIRRALDNLLQARERTPGRALVVVQPLQGRGQLPPGHQLLGPAEPDPGQRRILRGLRRSEAGLQQPQDVVSGLEPQQRGLQDVAQHGGPEPAGLPREPVGVEGVGADQGDRVRLVEELRVSHGLLGELHGGPAVALVKRQPDGRHDLIGLFVAEEPLVEGQVMGVPRGLGQGVEAAVGHRRPGADLHQQAVDLDPVERLGEHTLALQIPDLVPQRGLVDGGCCCQVSELVERGGELPDGGRHVDHRQELHDAAIRQIQVIEGSHHLRAQHVALVSPQV